MTITEASRLLELSLPLEAPAQLKEAYRDALMVWHPDRFVEDKLKAKAEVKTRQILEAYDLLKRLRSSDPRLYGGGIRHAEPAPAPAAELHRRSPAPERPPGRAARKRAQHQARCGPVKAVFRSLIFAVVAMALVVGVEMRNQPRPVRHPPISATRPVSNAAVPMTPQPAIWPTETDMAILKEDLAMAFPDEPELARMLVAQYRRLMKGGTVLPVRDPSEN